MYRLDLAKLPQIKTLEGFDISESSLDKKTLEDLAECKNIRLSNKFSVNF